MNIDSYNIFYITNVFEETIKLQRNITTDSPAANRKVISICSAIRRAGANVSIISLGRGRCKNSLRNYKITQAFLNDIPIIYMRYCDLPIITHVVSMISLFIYILNLANRKSIFVYYNFSLHYLLALFFCKLMGSHCFLDLEDGYRHDQKEIRTLPHKFLLSIYNTCCRSGVILAAEALREQTTGQNSLVCYGIADEIKLHHDWSSYPLQVHLGGSLLKDTGAILFLDTLEILSTRNPDIFEKLRFVVTGFGECARNIDLAAKGQMQKFLTFYGNVPLTEYQHIIDNSHIGMNLRLPDTSMGATTFPSKVMETTSRGMLLISTKVSDIPLLFDENTAVLLDKATPESLASALDSIAQNPSKAAEIASNGQLMMRSKFSAVAVGDKLLRFIYENTTLSNPHP